MFKEKLDAVVCSKSKMEINGKPDLNKWKKFANSLRLKTNY